MYFGFSNYLYFDFYSICTNFFTLASQYISSTRHYSLYWSGKTPNARFNGQTNDSFLCVWEAGTFSITATRVEEFNIPSLRNPPGEPGRFDGRLRGVSIYIKYDDGTYDKIVGGGIRESAIIRGRGGHLLKSHAPQMLIKAGSFWEYEESQTYNSSCIGNSKFLPGCFNSTDRHNSTYRNSSLTLKFPVGLASPPHGCFADGIISVLPTRFEGDWNYFPDYSSDRQSFVLLLIRMLYC